MRHVRRRLPSVAEELEHVETLDRPPGDSQEQRDAEAVLIAALSARLGVALAPRELRFDNGVRVKLDAASDDLSILVEAWAHQGVVKSAQRNKVLTDAFKLAFTSRALGGDRRLILLLSDDAAAKKFAGGWPAAALREFGVTVEVVEIDEETRRRIRAAQDRQYR